jgi:hypothetical protein
LTKVSYLHKVRTSCCFAADFGQVPKHEECLRSFAAKRIRVAAPLLSEDKESMAEAVNNNKPTLAPPTPAQQPIRIPQPAVAAQPQQQARAAGWEDTAKRWP